MSNEGAVILTEEPEITEPAETQGAIAEVGEFYDDREADDVVENSDLTEPSKESDDSHATEDATDVEEEAVDVPRSKKSSDRAFAEMRRANESLESQNAELLQRIEALEKANKMAQLIETATQMGLSDSEIEQVVADAEAEEQAEKERTDMQAEIMRLSEQVLNAEVEKAMQEDLAAIQAIDPSIKSISDLPEEFFTYRAVMPGLDAYFATKAKEQQTKFEGARELGKANSAPVDRDYYTSEELDRLTDKEMDANWDKVQRSLNRL